VEIVGPGEHHGKHGVIVKIVESRSGDFVHRYHVRFSDGTEYTFFGFEISQEAA
jgi:hypothetical protein